MSESRPRCPYCNSKQTRYTPSKSGILISRYTCKGCGNNFELENFGSDDTKPKGGCLASIIKILLFVVVVIVIMSILIATDEDKPKNKQPEQTQQHDTHIKEVEDAVEAERSEHAAHDYIPTEADYQEFEQKQKVQESDNLTTVETIRETE